MTLGQLSFSLLEIFLIFQAIIYLLLLPVWFLKWLRAMLINSPEHDPQRFVSFLILILATLLWPISVPMSYWELTQKEKEIKVSHPGTHRHLRLVS